MNSNIWNNLCCIYTNISNVWCKKAFYVLDITDFLPHNSLGMLLNATIYMSDIGKLMGISIENMGTYSSSTHLSKWQNPVGLLICF